MFVCVCVCVCVCVWGGGGCVSVHMNVFDEVSECYSNWINVLI